MSMSFKVQVIFYSMYGHVYKMAQAVVEGAKQVPGIEVSWYQGLSWIPDDVLEKYGAKAAKAAFSKLPVATVDQLADAHAIIFGTPTRFGNMAAQMRNFLDQTDPRGPKDRSSERSGACSLPPRRNTAGRRPR
jgi:NAD(P)H dehydrogenase (quinone)